MRPQCCQSWMLIRLPASPATPGPCVCCAGVRKGSRQPETQAAGALWPGHGLTRIGAWCAHDCMPTGSCGNAQTGFPHWFWRYPLPSRPRCPVCWGGPCRRLFSKAYVYVQRSPALPVWPSGRGEGCCQGGVGQGMANPISPSSVEYILWLRPHLERGREGRCMVRKGGARRPGCSLVQQFSPSFCKCLPNTYAPFLPGEIDHLRSKWMPN